MLDRLPVYIDPVSFADGGKTLSGSILISKMLRLSEMLFKDSMSVDINLSFSKVGRLPILQGQVKANLILQCQSCLQQLDLPIDKWIKLGFVTSLEQADKLVQDCEPVIFENQKVSLTELVEDELLLALPDFPRHQHQCVEKTENVLVTNDDNDEQKSDNPFSVLAQLKNTGE